LVEPGFQTTPEVGAKLSVHADEYHAWLNQIAFSRPSDAAEAADDLVQLKGGRPGIIYDAACLLALCIPPTASAAERTSYADRAMAMTRRAIAEEWFDCSKAARDPRLRTLQGYNQKSWTGSWRAAGYPW
jgi:hypothetical protein